MTVRHHGQGQSPFPAPRDGSRRRAIDLRPASLWRSCTRRKHDKPGSDAPIPHERGRVPAGVAQIRDWRRKGRGCPIETVAMRVRVFAPARDEAAPTRDQSLAWLREQLIGPGQTARNGVERFALVRQAACERTKSSPLQIEYLRHQFRPNRHGHFGCGRRRRRTRIGREIDQRGVGFVAHSGDQRDRAFGRRAPRRSLSLKAIRSSIEPPPRATIRTSGRGTGPPTGSALKPRIAAAISLAARSPCTATGHKSTRRGKRADSRCMMSRMTAPVGDVTTPITPGR